MLQSISWSQYFITLFIVTIIYYLAIWAFYYKGKFIFLTRLSNLRAAPLYAEDTDEVISTAQHVMDELRPLFANRTNKNELLLSLQLRLRKYNEWNEPGFRDTINAFIISMSESNCSIRLGEDDQRALWE